ncbi:DUF4433 domain-containing protein [Cupriavidus alkaliphilus]|uniref:DUF4433 domain-containing protein n=1 Tax=Cupriavidus alkaliphilus TaxID=942866 RepID=UPI0021A31544|nr:DUF4433 domain-containing protein [Cupriavidus alkaliphilus]
MRGIRRLAHFTREENLGAILRDGIVPRMQLEVANTPFLANDLHRLDGFRNASCFSIEHPNYKMFYRLRMENPATNWCVIVCRTELLSEIPCAYCVDNAAANSVTGIHIQDRMGEAAFHKLFDEYAGKPSRMEMGIPREYPTNPQAEILAFGTVSPRYFFGVACNTEAQRIRLSGAFPGTDFRYLPQYFSPRSDYAHWRA